MPSLPSLIDLDGWRLDVLSMDTWKGMVDFDDSFLALNIHAIIMVQNIWLL